MHRFLEVEKRTSLLDREDFCKEISQAIEKGERESMCLPPDTRREFIKLCIRECSVRFTGLKERQNKEEAELELQLLELDKDMYNSPEISWGLFYN